MYYRIAKNACKGERHETERLRQRSPWDWACIGSAPGTSTDARGSAGRGLSDQSGSRGAARRAARHRRAGAPGAQRLATRRSRSTAPRAPTTWTARKVTARSTPTRARSRLDQQIYSGGETVANTSAPRTWSASNAPAWSRSNSSVLLDAVDRVHQPARSRGGAGFRDPEREPPAPSAAGDPDRFEVGEVTRTDVAQAEARAVRRHRRSRAGRGRAGGRQGRLPARDQPGARPAGGAGAAARRCRTARRKRSRSPKSTTRTSRSAQFDLAAARAEVDVATVGVAATAFG